MQCLDFERLLNEQLDARDLASPELDRALEAHAAVCPTCRLTASRYQMLRQVIQTVVRPTAPSLDFLPRFLESQELDRPLTYRRFTMRKVMTPLAMAASLLLVAFLGWRAFPDPPAPLAQTDTPSLPIDEPPLLTDALASAGSATWNFALETSEPAARIGREFLDAASFQERSTATLAFTLPNSAPSEVLESVGDRVNDRVRPFSGAARHAFGFLLGPPAEPTNPVTTPSNSG